MTEQSALAGYAAGAAEIIPRFEAISPADLFAPVAEFLPAAACSILDIGAGTGRDAAWFAIRGHRVLAVEPVEEFRSAGQKIHPVGNIEWLGDRLPALNGVVAMGRRFDRIFLIAVWQHLNADERALAMPRLAALLASGGIFVMSVRQGAGAQDRPCFETDIDSTVRGAEASGLKILACRKSPSVQSANRAAGVTWKWLVFSKG